MDFARRLASMIDDQDDMLILSSRFGGSELVVEWAYKGRFRIVVGRVEDGDL